MKHNGTVLDMEQISAISMRRNRLALLLLASSVFAVGTEGLVFAGLLPALSSDLDVSLGAAGFRRLPAWQDAVARCLEDLAHTEA